MDGPLDTLRDLASQVGAVVADAFGQASVRDLTDGELVATMDAAGQLLRSAQALIAETAGEVEARSDAPDRAERLTTRWGCRTTRELVERVTRVSGRSAGDLVRAGRAVALTRSALTGQALPARYPALRASFAASAVTVDAVVGITIVLDAATTTHEHRAAAERGLAAAAPGDSAESTEGASDAASIVESGALPTADDLRLQAQVWAAYLDPDGAEPRDEKAQRLRGLSLGRCRDGLVPLSGHLLPEVAGQLQREWDAILNPAASTPVFTDSAQPDTGEAHDPRTGRQKNHDAFATILSAAARAGELPTLGGAAPTLVVSVRADDLVAGGGVGHIDGVDEPVSMTVARHVACAGGILRVTKTANGRPVALEVVDRVFTAHQRKAITLRDGHCIIPGCRVRAAWCEIHHVVEASRGGATATDNGVLLCWHHHRTLETGGWHIRMRGGVPEVRGPSWWDRAGRWRPVTKSPVGLRDHHDQRVRQQI
jgi:hypothetical protein